MQDALRGVTPSIRGFLGGIDDAGWVARYVHSTRLQAATRYVTRRTSSVTGVSPASSTLARCASTEGCSTVPL